MDQFQVLAIGLAGTVIALCFLPVLEAWLNRLTDRHFVKRMVERGVSEDEAVVTVAQWRREFEARS